MLGTPDAESLQQRSTRQPRQSVCAAARLALLAAGVLLLAACQAKLSVHGNMPEMSELAAIQPGEDDRDTVLNQLGTPSSSSTFEDNKWYYIGSKIEQEAYFLPEEVDRQILIITFDDFGVVEKTEFLGMDDAIEVEPESRITPTEGKNFTVWQQLFGNFGRLPGAVGGKQTR